MVATSFYSTLFFALAVVAHPVERGGSFPHLSFTKRIIDEIFNIVELDLLHVKFIKGIDIFGHSSPAVNKAVSYVAPVGVGDPPTYYDLIIDTGSANIWVGANKPYVKTSTSHKTDSSVYVKYGSASFNGTEYTDQITISSDLVIPCQSIGVATTSANFSSDVDGIIGVGPTNLTNHTLTPNKNIPTVTDNLFAEHVIDIALLSISFEPITTDNSTVGQMNGELTWGGIDPTKFIGDITFTPITTVYPARKYWGIDASINYGDIALLPGTAGIVDTGTSLFLLATDVFQHYQKVTGSVLDEVTSMLKVTSAQYAKLKSIYVTVQGVPFELTPNGQIWPRQLNALLGGTASGIYLIVSDLGTPSGSGLDFFLGQAFLERFYSVYDTTNSKVGLAKTKYTDATTN